MIRGMMLSTKECRWTLILATVALMAHVPVRAVSDSLAEALTFDRGAILAGQAWRMLGGHFVHFTMEQLAWNLAVFIALGCLCERRLGAAYLPALAGSALVVSVGLLLLNAGITRYRGLSGIASALFVLTVLLTATDAIRSRRIALLSLSLAGAILFAGKVLHESISGAALFSRDLPAAGVVPVPLAHGLGAIAGGMIFMVSRPITRPGSSRRRYIPLGQLKGGPREESSSCRAAPRSEARLGANGTDSRSQDRSGWGGGRGTSSR